MKYISEETKDKLKFLNKFENKIKNISKKEIKQHLLKTGLYDKNGKLKDV